MKKCNLKEIVGLSDKESIVYQAVLNGGKLTQSEIAKATGLNRTSLYPYIKTLLQKDLVQKSPQGKRLVYTANSPKKLMANASEALHSLETALPAMLSVYQQVGHKPNFALYEGGDAIYKEMIRFCEEAPYLKSFASPHNFLTVLTRKQANDMIRIMEKRDLRVTTLTSHTRENVDIVQTFQSPNLEWRAMPAGLQYPIEITFSVRTVLLISWQQKFLARIDSEDIAQFIETLYDYFWRTAKQVRQ